MKDPVPAAQYELECSRQRAPAAALETEAQTAASAGKAPAVRASSVPTCRAAAVALLVAAACLAFRRRVAKGEGTASEQTLLVK